MEVEPEVIDCMNDMLNFVVKKEEKRLRDKQYYKKNKQQRSQQQKQYYEENKQKIIEQQKEYQKQNREKRRLRHKQYYEKNKQQISQQQKQRYEENKEQISQRYKEYYNQNKEQISQQQKQYNKTPERVKSRRIYDWKRIGVICDDFDALYEHYLKISYCEFCRCELTYDKVSTSTTKCLDHDHSITDRPNFRNILCQSCNVKRR